MQEIINETKQQMDQSIDHLKDDLKNIRTGRASPTMLDGVTVDVYGTKMRLRDLSNITTPEARQLLVTPFDQNNLGSINKGIEKADLGLQPIVDGNSIRINIPEMDEAKRKEMVRLAWDRCEKSKVSIREARRKGNELLKAAKASSKITIDELKVGEKKVQEITDQFCKLADTTTSSKEQEVLAI